MSKFTRWWLRLIARHLDAMAWRLDPDHGDQSLRDASFLIRVSTGDVKLMYEWKTL